MDEVVQLFNDIDRILRDNGVEPDLTIVITNGPNDTRKYISFDELTHGGRKHGWIIWRVLGVETILGYFDLHRDDHLIINNLDLENDDLVTYPIDAIVNVDVDRRVPICFKPPELFKEYHKRKTLNILIDKL